MARKRFSDEDVIRLLRQIEVETASGASVAEACRSAGVSDATYYGWRKKFVSVDFEVFSWCFTKIYGRNPHIIRW